MFLLVLKIIVINFHINIFKLCIVVFSMAEKQESKIPKDSAKPFYNKMSKEVVKRAVVAGAACAAKFKERNPKATEQETVAYVIKEMRKIIKEIDEAI